jgi:hypothetical protein
MINFPGSKNLDVFRRILNQPAFPQLIHVDDHAGLKGIQLIKIERSGIPAEPAPKSPLWQTPRQGHLTAFKSVSDTTAGPGILAFVAFTGCPAVSGTVSPADPLPLFSRSRRRR